MYSVPSWAVSMDTSLFSSPKSSTDSQPSSVWRSRPLPMLV